MSARIGSKSLKRTSSVAKKKGLSTPDTSGTPTASASSIGDKPPEPSIDDVLQGEDVQALRIREEELGKLHPPKPARRPGRTQKVVVKRATAEEIVRPKHRGVAVLHPLPPGTELSPTKILGSPRPGPRFDVGRSFIPHSILGSTEHYAMELKNRGLVGSPSAFSKPPPVVLPHIKRTPTAPEMTYEKTIVPRESHALEHWNRSMEERQSQQTYLSNTLNSSPEKLLMNQGEGYRAVQEERMQIDRAIPSVDYGKGYRVGSEFWSQHVNVGNESTGITTTLTQTERGLAPELEFVGVPAVVRREKGTDCIERNAPLHYTYSWRQSSYLSTRREQLGATLNTEIFQPDVSELQVIGHTPGHAHSHTHTPRRDSLDSIGDSSELSSEEESEHKSVLDMQRDITTQPILGPALRVGQRLLQWEGPPTAKVQNPLEVRVLFESSVGERTTSHLDMENCGTTAIYYSWQVLPKPNPLCTIQSGDIQRFYFDTRGGVLLPGQKLAFPVVFKSPNAGIFTEMWALQTGPVLCRGRPITVFLKGVAFLEDINAGKREEIERMLTHRVAVTAAERLVNKLVDSIRTPPRSPRPFETTTLEEDVFLSKNPGLFYHHGVVQQLKTVYDEILRPETLSEELPPEPSATIKTEKGGKKDKVDVKKERASKEKTKGKPQPVKEEPTEPAAPKEPTVEVPDWDLAIASLQEVIMGVKETEQREEKLQQLSSLVGALSFPPPRYSRKKRYNIGYQVLCEAMDSISGVSIHLCHLMGLPVRECCSAIRQPPLVEEEQTPSAPSSPASSGKKGDKKGGKDAKPKADSKQKGGTTTSKDRAPSSKSKSVPTKKSKAIVNIKESELPDVPTEIPTVAVEVDPLMEKNYREKFYTCAYEILGSAVEKMSSLFEDVV